MMIIAAPFGSLLLMCITMSVLWLRPCVLSSDYTGRPKIDIHGIHTIWQTPPCEDPIVSLKMFLLTGPRSHVGVYQ